MSFRDAIHRMTKKVYGGGGRPQSSGGRLSTRSKKWRDSYLIESDRQASKKHDWENIGYSTKEMVDKVDRLATMRADKINKGLSNVPYNRKVNLKTKFTPPPIPRSPNRGYGKPNPSDPLNKILHTKKRK